uniref:Androgen-binding protein alpha subunit n=1 Tax=Moschus moschiferus TaxID=68415 RepID=A0A8C6CGF1_MOSMO
MLGVFQGVSPYLSVSECDDICPALRDTVDLFISGSHEAYIEQVEKYNQNPNVLETADTLKNCVDEKLTAEDKQNALSALNKIYSSSLC